MFVVSDTLGITASVVATGKVRPDPGITGGGGTWVGDRADLAMDVFDPDKNLQNGASVAAAYEAFYDNFYLRTFYEDAHIEWAETYAPKLKANFSQR